MDAIWIVALLWLPWPILAAVAQHQRRGSIVQGVIVGLLFGPLGLLVANYSGGKKCPHCLSRVAHRKATRCAGCGESLD